MAEAVLEALLEVQAHDLAMDQLRYRRQALPVRNALENLRSRLADLERSKETTAARRRELERVQRRLEDQVDTIEAKATDSESRLYGGQVQAPRELQALASEVASLRDRKRTLEDELLQVMESIEPVAEELDRLAGEGRALAREAERCTSVLAEQEAEIDEQLASEAELRSGVATGVPDGLLATYDGLRRRLDGVGIARVDAGRCTGCHLSLSAVELDSLRRSAGGSVVRHEECGRILVP